MALAVVSLLWFTQVTAPWATVMCGVGAVGGALGVLYFGWRYLRSRGNAQ
ncbi:Protein of unknown function [Streptomyces sp. 2224.1]|nr:Protein of unknown function [Streptomyces sp. 2224.1]